MRDGDWLRALWEGDSLGSRAARAALMPAELLFGIGSVVRSSLYSSGVLSSHPTPIPALSVGNLTVGGTGKTPIAAYLARRLQEHGAKPAIVLRGYGDDEPLVHRALNPDVPVVVSADRLAGVTQAKRAGCDVAVLDDAFQHRRVQRVADIVLIGADTMWDKRRHFLPAGPWREPLAAARRASLVIVTRKAAPLDRAGVVLGAVTQTADVPAAIVHLDASELRNASGAEVVDVGIIRGESVLVISGIGDPRAFHTQLSARGARVTSRAFRDHHRFTSADASELAKLASQFDRVVCTLKDAVKLGPLWPGPSPLWYVSQRVVIDRGADALDRVLAATLLAGSASPEIARLGLPGQPD